MAFPVPTLDHVVINARDEIDLAAATFRRLGFTLTERGYHSLGSMNHLAMFGTDYLELIAVPRGAAPDIRPDVMAAPFGLSGLVFGSEDTTATYESLKASGFELRPPREFTRPVTVGDTTRDARFRTVTLERGDVPYGRVYFCHHFTRDLVWRDEWRHHPNGAVAVQRFVIVHPDPADAARVYTRIFGDQAVRDIPGGRAVIAAGTQVDILTEDALSREFGNAAPSAVGRETYMAALTFRTLSLAQTASVFKENGVEGVREMDGKIIVPGPSGLNTALTFVE